jgi:2',3'-cyclic-nucleotide 2'-phosphodiesterase/3'-nucleotidase
MKRTHTLLLSLLATAMAIAITASGARPERVRITLLGTTDLHGNLFPVDYYRNQPAERGLAKVATLVRQVRAERKHVLLLDSGDTIQGTPLAYYFARKEPAAPNPTIAAMNALGFDAMAVGNHEFNFGLENLWKAKREAKFPWLAANIESDYTDDRAFRPYVIREVGGVRVGVVGFITPAVPNWEIPANYAGYRFRPIVETASRLIPEVRAKADLVVVIAHSGLGRDPATGEPRDDGFAGEDAIWDLAEQVPGIDVILFGHSHQELPGKFVNGVLLVQAKNWGQSLAQVDVEMEHTQAGWRVAGKSARTIPVTASVPADPEIVAVAQQPHDTTNGWLDQPVATLAEDLDAWDARYRDHPMVELIHQVQMHYGDAQVSMATKFLPSLRIPAGPVTVRQIAGLYIYENTLYVVELTGEQIRAALEHAASYFPAWPHTGEGPMRLPGYNADMAEGVDYYVDLRRPVGSRIRDLQYRGRPLDPRKKLRVAINNYRHAGGGRYEVYRGTEVLYRSPVEVRELIIEYVTERGTLPTTANGNWRIEPPEALEAILEQVRSRGERYGASVPPRPAPLWSENILTLPGHLATFPRELLSFGSGTARRVAAVHGKR